jgi:hypothetical protein
MSNTLPTSSVTTAEMKQFKKDFVELISNGYIEAKALQELNLSRGVFVRYCMEDPEFIKQIEEARKNRAEFWISKIANSVDDVLDAKEVPSEKLKFDKLMYLAKADNPDRYGVGKTKVDISLDLKQFKLLPPEEAVKALANDPFAAVEAEFTEVPDNEGSVEDAASIPQECEDEELL